MAKMTAAEREIKEKRARVYKGMADIMAKRADGVELTDDDRAEYDKRSKQLRKLDGDLERVQDYNKREEVRDDIAETRGESRDESDSTEKRYEQAFETWFRRGDKGLSAEQRTVLDANSLTTTGTEPGTAGATGFDAGYLIPVGFWHNLQIALKAYGGILGRCRMVQTASGQPMPWPTVDPTGVIGSYITETNQLGFGGDSQGTDYQFGQGMLNAWTIVSGVILASIQLINDSAFDVNQFVSDRMGEAIGRKVAQELHTGTGSSAFLGVETALSARGHRSGPAQGGVYRSGSATNWSATAGGSAFTIAGGTTAQTKLANGLIGFDDILGMIETVDPAYRQSGRCVFVANDVTLSMLRTITDAYGHPLWSPAVAPGQPDTLYGYPVMVDQNTSNVPTTASTVGGLLFGDFQTAMVVRQVNQSGVMRLTERYADFLQVGYLGWTRMDARSNDLRAAALYSTNAT
jgi:HK97 family phage major capsid protein